MRAAFVLAGCMLAGTRLDAQGVIRRHAIIRRDIVDWTHEMLIVVSYGGGPLPLDPRRGINRVRAGADHITVLLGPDSVSGSALQTTGWVPATVIAVPRTRLAVVYEPILPTTPVPPTTT